MNSHEFAQVLHEFAKIKYMLNLLFFVKIAKTK